ncbi:hypothetical protein RCJ22_23695 [Vibrio sp. FNV 38]|nr:hypothetical protein [Vibrio sp. FNV 38]
MNTKQRLSYNIELFNCNIKGMIDRDPDTFILESDWTLGCLHWKFNGEIETGIIDCVHQLSIATKNTSILDKLNRGRLTAIISAWVNKNGGLPEQYHFNFSWIELFNMYGVDTTKYLNDHLKINAVEPTIKEQ